MPDDMTSVKEKEAKYLFARLNIVYYQANLFDGALPKSELIDQALKEAGPLQFSSYLWEILNFQKLSNGQGDFVTGTLAKFRDVGQTPVADREAHVSTYQQVNNQIGAESRFFLHVASGLLIYHPISGEIDNSVFRNRFLSLFHKGLGDQVKAEISTIDDRFQVLKEFETFDAITKITIDLVPSNPHFAPEWQPTDERMKRLRLARLKEEYIVKSDDLGNELKADSDIKAKISMAEDGYGRATVKGTKEGKVKSIRTQDLPVFAKVWQSSDTPPATVLEHVAGKITEIFSRFVQ